MKKDWIRLKDLIGVRGFPQTIQGLTQRAKLENWQRRRVEGVKGRVFEYHISSLPTDVIEQIKTRIANETSESSDEVNQSPQRNITINEGLLRQAIEEVETRLNARRQILPAKKKAKLIVLICHSYNKQSPINQSTIDQLLDLAI